jgi:spore germination protein GerM
MKKIILIVLVVSVAVVVGYCIYQSKIEKPISCTTEAKICPDGSAVGRTGPNCEFSTCPVKKQTIKLYYYNPTKDKDETGNILCSRQGLEAVERNIPVTQTPIQDTIKLLLKGGLTQEEKDKGVSTEYPLSGVELTGASLNNGELKLSFNDPENKTGGGSCRVGILWFQIEATAKQFGEVKSVKFLPEELFQP